MRLQIRCIDHDCLVLAAFGGKTCHDPGEHPVVAPALPAVVERLRRTVFPGCITPSQAIAVDEDYAAKHAAIIDPRPAMALRKERLQALHLRLGQPVEITHRTGLLAEPESRQSPEINGSGAYIVKRFKIMDRIFSDRLRLIIWWSLQTLIALNITRYIVSLNKPEIMPAVGAFASVFSFLFYTRRKGKHDDLVRAYQLEMVEMMVRNNVDSERYYNHKMKGEFEKRDYEIACIRHLFRNLKNDHEAFKRYGPNGPSGNQLSGLSALSRAMNSEPHRPEHQPPHVRISQDGYLISIRNWKKAIRENQSWSSRFSTLEGAAIFYSAIVSAFGAEFVRWWHSLPNNWWRSLPFVS